MARPRAAWQRSRSQSLRSTTRRWRPTTTATPRPKTRSEEHTSELQSLRQLVCRLLLEKKRSAETAGTRSSAGASGSPAVTPPPDATPERAVDGPRRPDGAQSSFALPKRLGDREASIAGFLDELGGQPDLPTPA